MFWSADSIREAQEEDYGTRQVWQWICEKAPQPVRPALSVEEVQVRQLVVQWSELTDIKSKKAPDKYMKNRLTANMKYPKSFWAELQKLLPKGAKVASLNLKDSNGEDIASADTSGFINQYFANIGKNLADKTLVVEDKL